MTSSIALRSAVCRLIEKTFGDRLTISESYAPVTPEDNVLFQVRIAGDDIVRADRLHYDRRITLACSLTWPMTGHDRDASIDTHLELAAVLRNMLLITRVHGYICILANMNEPLINEAASGSGNYLVIDLKAVFRNAVEKIGEGNISSTYENLIKENV